jgi:hypothetical protein
MNNSRCHSGAKIGSKFEKHDLARMPDTPDSPDISPRDFGFFGMLNGILKDQEFISSDEIGDAIAKVWDDSTFDDTQNPGATG